MLLLSWLLWSLLFVNVVAVAVVVKRVADVLFFPVGIAVVVVAVVCVAAVVVVCVCCC